MAAVIAGLVVGKPLGIIAASLLAVRLKLAVKPKEYSWAQLAGAGALAGIGFTMSLFIAGQAFPAEADFEAAKIAVLAASVVSAAIGVAALSIAGESRRNDRSGARGERIGRPARLPISPDVSSRREKPPRDGLFRTALSGRRRKASERVSRHTIAVVEVSKTGTLVLKCSPDDSRLMGGVT